MNPPALSCVCTLLPGIRRCQNTADTYTVQWKGVRAPSSKCAQSEGSFPDCLHRGDVTSSGVDAAAPTAHPHAYSAITTCQSGEAKLHSFGYKIAPKGGSPLLLRGARGVNSSLIWGEEVAPLDRFNVKLSKRKRWKSKGVKSLPVRAILLHLMHCFE